MINSSLHPIHIGIVFLELSLYFLANVRVNIVVDHAMMVHLVFGDETHVEEPVFVVHVFHADFCKLSAIYFFVFIIVVFSKFVLVGLVDL